MKYYNQLGNEDYIVVNTGRRISKKMVTNLITKSLLIPCNDGLFGDSQMFKAIQENRRVANADGGGF